MLIDINLWLGRLAPWLWMIASIFALLIGQDDLRKLLLIGRPDGQKISSATVEQLKTTWTTALWLTGISVGMVVVGALSLITWFYFPVLRAHRYEGIPSLLQWQSFVTVIVLLMFPVAAGRILWRKSRLLRALLHFDSTPSLGGAPSAEKKSP